MPILPMMKYRKRCRFCWKYFQTNIKHAKYCPGTNHRMLHWLEQHPRVVLERPKKAATS